MTLFQISNKTYKDNNLIIFKCFVPCADYIRLLNIRASVIFAIKKKYNNINGG
jgi:hypothetical protein